MAAHLFATGRCAFRCKPALLQVRARGRPCTRATSNDRAQKSAKNSSKPEEKRSKSKETVVIFERRGEGWGEELFPTVSVSTREVLAKKPRRDRDLETALGNLEFLGIEAEEGRKILEEASSWRTTRQGRALIDKKLRKRVQRNVAVIACLLQEKYGIEYARTAALVRELPLVLSIDFTDAWADNYLDYMLTCKGILDAEHLEQVEARSRLSEPVETDSAKAPSTARPTYSTDMSLEEWVEWQTLMKTQGRLGQQRIRLLEYAGIKWCIMDDAWEDSFDELISFKLYNGHSDVFLEDAEFPATPELRQWVEQQRELYKAGKLPSQGVERLELLEVDLDPVPEDWPHRLSQLRTYKSYFGDCNIPKGWQPEPTLAAWLQQQRKLHENGQLSEKWMAKLEEAGVELGSQSREEKHAPRPPKKSDSRVREKPKKRKQAMVVSNVPLQGDQDEWEMQFQALLKFKEENGNLNVPLRSGDDSLLPLAAWMLVQRQLKRKGELPAERELRLTQMGFDWVTRRSRAKPNNVVRSKAADARA